MRRAVYIGPDGGDYGDGDPSTIFYGHQGYSDSDITELNRHNNVLLYDLKNGVLCFMPSTQSNGYITDFTFWRKKLGRNSLLKVGTDGSKMNAVMAVANKLAPRLEKVANSDTKLHAATFDDVDRRFAYAAGFAVFIQIVVLLMYLSYRTKDPYGGGPGDGIPDESYDAGFDEGYYYGSNNPNH